MIIEQSGNVIREARLDERLVITGRPNQLWHLKEFNDASSQGFEFIWNYPDYVTGKDVPPDGVQYQNLSEDIFALTLPCHIKLKENQNLLIFPHHYYFFNPNNTPLPILQVIEFDWWVGYLRVIFANKEAIFEKDKPFAQAVVIPRKECTIKQMPINVVNELDESFEFVKLKELEIATRIQDTKDGKTLTNAYERLSHLNKNGSLPHEIKQKPEQSLRLSWHGKK